MVRRRTISLVLNAFMLLMVSCQAANCPAQDFPPIRLHPQNPRVFEFRGKPLVLITATEHYGAVMNRPFDFERYLTDAAEKRMTLTRLFVLFRELQTPVNPYSTCKPESTDYVSPYPRSGPGLAADQLPKYDLDQWNPEFFQRLHGFLSAAAKRGIVVEVTLLSNTYNNNVWALNPLNPRNNINGTEIIQPAEYLSMRHPRLLARQQTLVRKVVAECNRYDNVIFEICNEPFASLPATIPSGTRRNPDSDEMDRWLTKVARTIRDAEATLPRRHLISGQASYTSPPTPPRVGLSLTSSFKTFPVDIVNVHNDRSITFEDKFYDLGGFMTAELRLKELQSLFLATAKERKPLSLDEDNAASRFTNVPGWTIDRKRAWTTVLNGGHYDVIDFTIQNRLETGTPEAQQHIRAWMKHLSTLVHSLDLVNARPMPQIVKQSPEHTIASVLGVEGKEYAIYLADAREVTDKGLGDAISGTVTVTLAPGSWRCVVEHPVTGESKKPLIIQGGNITIPLPAFSHDIAMRIVR